MRGSGILLVGVALAGSGLVLGSCGTALPYMDYRHPEGVRYNKFVTAIAGHVRCELREAVKREWLPKPSKRAVLQTWAAKIALTLTAEDRGHSNPNASYFNVAETFTAAVGADLSATATREITITYFVPFAELLADPSRGSYENGDPICDRLEPDPIAGNLKIHQTLEAALMPWDGNNTLGETVSGGPYDTITHHVTFDVEATGSATPSWKLVRVNVNPSGPFLAATRKQTDELLITVGPAVLSGRTIIPSPALNDAFQTERLRSAIRDR